MPIFNKGRLLPGEVAIQKDKLAELQEDSEYLRAFFGTFGLVTDLMANAFRRIQTSDGDDGIMAMGEYNTCMKIRDAMVEKMDKRKKRDGDEIPF